MPILNSQTVRNAVDDDYYVRKGANGDSTITGDLYVTGSIYESGNKVFPSAVKITTAGSITKQATATVVPESAFTVPAGFDGYYSFTAQVLLNGVGTVADGENISIYLDVSGGSLTPVNGTINIIDMTENAANSFSQAPSGIIMQRLTAGQVIQLYHLENGSYTFSSGSIQVAYTYLGDRLLA
jgi:hypothetical protein